MSLTTTARVKAALMIPTGVTFHDSALGFAVDAANDYILSKIGQSAGLVATTRTEYPEVYRPGQTKLLLARSPIVSIIAVTNASGLLVEGTDYRVDTEIGQLRIIQGQITSRGVVAAWSDVPDDVVVTYIHGYTAATVPDRLIRAATMVAAANSQGIRNAGHKRVRNSSMTLEMSELVIPPLVAQILSSFEDVHR